MSEVSGWDYGPGNMNDPGVDYAWESQVSPVSDSANAGGGFLSGLGDVFAYGLKRVIDSKADVYLQQNAQPQLAYDGYGRPYNPAYGPLPPPQGAGSSQSTLLLIAGAVAIALLAG